MCACVRRKSRGWGSDTQAASAHRKTGGQEGMRQHRIPSPSWTSPDLHPSPALVLSSKIHVQLNVETGTYRDCQHFALKVDKTIKEKQP